MKLASDLRKPFYRMSLIAICFIQLGCDGQSVLQYRLPYANGTDIYVSNDHLTHGPSDRLDLVGVNDGTTYSVVAANTGVVEYVEDSSALNCCMGTCANNFVWLSHIGEEWTKYSHLATGSATNVAGLEVGDIVIAGQFLGFESDVGRACGQHLHFEVGVPDDINNPLSNSNGGYIIGENRPPRFCQVPGELVVEDNTYRAEHCDNLLTCIRSVETPLTENNCEDGLSGEVCVQEVSSVEDSTYRIDEDFDSSSVNLNLDWCPNAECDNDLTGRAIQVVVIFDDELNKDPVDFIANCRNPTINETVHNVQEIRVQQTLNLSPENTECGGNSLLHAFSKWEFCEVNPIFADRSTAR